MRQRKKPLRCRLGLHKKRLRQGPWATKTFLLIGVNLYECERCAWFVQGMGEKASKRELLCQRCDHDYPVWFAPNDLWNAVIRGGSKGGNESPDENFLCPSCFAALACGREAVGPHTIWRFEVDD